MGCSTAKVPRALVQSGSSGSQGRKAETKSNLYSIASMK
jgi:hypothetical protein